MTTGRTVAFGHVGLQVADLDRSLKFYRDVLGLVEIERQLRSDAYLQHVTGYAGVELDIAVLAEAASGTLLELLEYRGVPRTPVDPATANPGTAHVCFEVDDVDAVYQRALEAGARAVNNPVTPTSGRWTGGRSVYLVDPDGIRIELVERAMPPRVDVDLIYLVEADFAPDAEERRKPYRAAHQARVAELKRAGVVLEAGAFLDRLSMSILLVRASTAEEAKRVALDDVYAATGVWMAVRARPFGRVSVGTLSEPRTGETAKEV